LVAISKSAAAKFHCRNEKWPEPVKLTSEADAEQLESVQLVSTAPKFAPAMRGMSRSRESEA